MRVAERVRRARDLDDDHLHQVGVVPVAVDDERRDRAELLAHRDRLRVDLADQLEHHVPALEEQRVEHLVLGGEVVVDEAVGDAGLVGDVRHAAGVEALAREHPHRRVQDQPALVRRARARGRMRARLLMRPPRPASDRPGAAIGERGQARADLPLALEVELGDDVSLAVGGLRQHHAPRVDDHRAPAGMLSRRGARRPGWRRSRTPGSRSPAPAAAPPSDRAWSPA